MRTRVAIGVLLMVGTVLAAHVIIGDRTLSPAELNTVRAACPECHGEVPDYDRALRVHNRHAALDCSLCHHAERGLKTTDTIHTTLKTVGAGTLLLALIGMVMNISVIRRRGGP